MADTITKLKGIFWTVWKSPPIVALRAYLAERHAGYYARRSQKPGKTGVSSEKQRGGNRSRS